MTLVPAHSHLIRGVEGKPGPITKVCAVPGCISLAQQRHHVWPRSYLRGQPVEWVRLPSGTVIQNTVGLCVRHHDWVTGEVGGHRASIMLEGDTLLWAERPGSGDWEIMGALAQPQHAVAVDSHQDLAEGEVCPHCGYRKPRRTEPGPKRQAKTWAVVVPDDAEIGAEILDDWVSDFAVLFGFEDASARLRRYHVLAPVLAWAMQNKALLIADIRETTNA